MKKHILILIFFNLGFLFFCIFSCQYNEDPRISFECLDYDFGETYSLDTLIYEFKFKNSGRRDLSVNNIKTECGCTVANWTHGLIKNSATGSILIKYKTSSPKEFKEVIYVYHNGKNSPIRLSVKGKISPDHN